MKLKVVYDNDVLRGNRRQFLKSCIAGGLFLGSASPLQIIPKLAKGTNRTSLKPPNIIFIFADDWGYGDLGIHGSKFCKTPNLDRMAREGIDFQQFTVNNPVCSPSRTAVMTGQFPARHCIHRHFASVEHHQKAGTPDWLDPKLPLLPKLLKKAGYITGHFGKWHLTNRHVPDAPLPREYGYDQYGAFNVPGPQIRTAETCPRAVDFIRRHKDQSFFINVWLHETHTPHYPLPKYLKRFEHLDEQKRVYAAVVAEADAGIGSILGTLKKLGLDENTLVIFSSDNGPEWTGKRTGQDDNSTGRGLGTYYSVGETAGLKGQKRSLFAGGIRVPFIARWPGVIPKGAIDRTSVLTGVDLLPTFLELAGQSIPADLKLDGESIVSALKGLGFKRTKPIHWEWRGGHGPPYLWPHLGIRDGKWKMLVNQELSRTELYDIEADWAETTNVAVDNPDVVGALTEKVLAWKRSLPTKPPVHCFSRLRTAKGVKHFQDVRMWESGRYVQHYDFPQRDFRNNKGQQLACNADLDVVAWPASLTFNLTISPAHPIRNAVLRLSLKSEAGTWSQEKKIEGLWKSEKTQSVSMTCRVPIAMRVPHADISVTTENGQRILVRFDDTKDCYVASVNRLKRSWPTEYTDIRHYDEFTIPVDRSNANESIPFRLEMGQPANMTGLCPILCDDEGRPTDIPVQLSKNWHYKPMGAYLMAYTMLPADKAATYILRVVYGFYGTLPSASHAQLSLIGYGGNGRWDQSAIGCWGETICFDMDMSLVDVAITDIRMLMTMPQILIQ